MANVKISALPATTTIANGDVLPLVSGGATTKASMGQTGANKLPFSNANGNMLHGTVTDAASSQRLQIEHDFSSGSDIARFENTTYGKKLYVITDSGGSGIFDGASESGEGIYLNSTLNKTSFFAGSASIASISSVGLVPETHNTRDLGTTAVRWKDLWLQSGAFNGSDERLKTEIRPLTAKELEASKRLSKEVGTYQWLESVKEKGEKARRHVGFTVQKAIQIMQDCGLNPFDYGFIGYDEWGDRIVHHEEIKAVKAAPAVMVDDGNVLKEAVAEVKAVKAWDEIVLKAGDVFSFRYDQLNMFIARGFEARLSALESK